MEHLDKSETLIPCREAVAENQGIPTEEMESRSNITSVFNVIPFALDTSYSNQSLGEWPAGGHGDYSHEDNEFFCAFLAITEDNESAIRDIVSNLRSAPVLDELIFCRPELIATQDALIEGYFSNGLLDNRAVSANALIYLSALLLGVPLLEDFSGCTEGDIFKFIPSASDVKSFRNDSMDLIEELDLAEISESILSHPNCPASLKEAISNL